MPAGIIRITEGTLTYTVTRINVSNGLGDAAGIDLIGNQAPNSTEINHDLTKDNAKERWPRLKEQILHTESTLQPELEELEMSMKQAGWF